MRNPSKPTLPLEEVARYPLPGLAIPGMIQFSPDDALISYLYSPERNLVRHLYAFNPQTGEASFLVRPLAKSAQEDDLSLEEQLRRERLRQIELGITQYAWAKEANRLLVPLPDGIYVQDGKAGELRKLADGSQSPCLEARFSPDGEWVTFVQDNEIKVVSAHGGDIRQITWGAREKGVSQGLAEYIAQEEMLRAEGYWWSPDGQWLAFTVVDESHIPVYRIVHQGKDVTGEAAQEDHRYPFVGQPNAHVRLGVIAREGGDPVWMDLGDDPDIYLARVNWMPDGTLMAQIENRAQTQLDLVRFDPQTGAGTRVLRETSSLWINLHDLFRPLNKGQGALEGGFIWASERSGFRHLYLCSPRGELVRQLTQGEWLVDNLAGVDEDKGLVYFTASKESPLERHLYVVSLDGSQPRRLTQEPGMHAVVLDHGGKRFVDTYDALDHPPSVSLRSLADGQLLQNIYAESDPRVQSLQLKPPELIELTNRSGVQLYGAIYRPPVEYGNGPYPTIVAVYGGPSAQMVTNSWLRTISMRAQYLRQLGFLVFTLDNRGSARRGLAFEGAIHHDMGHLEVDDQVDGVNWLIEQGLADPERVGVYGWSYGGYMALMCLTRAPETFKAAVAGAPVSSWDGYDTHYTERYMGTPQGNPQGYDQSRVMAHVANLQGKLMLVHGLIDENVHFRHTARLITSLIAERKTYQLLLFPDERHLPRRLEDRVFMEEQICDFFVHSLMAE
jgi:dipeptidyl-peptidase 4